MARIGDLASAQGKRAAEHREKQKKRNIHYDVGPYWKTQNKTSSKKKQGNSVPFRDLMLPNQVASTRFTPENVKKADKTIKAYQPSKMEQFRDNIAKIFTASPHQNTQKTQKNSLWNAPLNQSDLASRHMSNNEAGVKSKTSPTKVGGGGGRDGKIDRKKDKFSPAKLLLGTVVKGSDEAATGIAHAAKLLIGGNITNAGLLLGKDWSDNPVNKLSDKLDKDAKTNKKYFAGNVKEGGKVAKAIDWAGTQTVQAIPAAVLAVMTGGANEAGALGANVASRTPGMLNSLKTAATTMAKDPNYWASFLSTVGNDYKNAREDGASDVKSGLYAMANSVVNAMVEVGGDTGNGGIQTLPKEMKKSGSALKKWVSSMVDEGKEEVVQGAIERGFQNLIYRKGNKTFSANDQNAVLNPKTAAKEFGGGALVGGILGGGQILANAALSGKDSRSSETDVQSETPVLDSVKNAQSDTPILDAVKGKSGTPILDSVRNAVSQAAPAEENAQAVETEKNAPKNKSAQSGDKGPLTKERIFDILSGGKRINTAGMDAGTFDSVADTGAAMDASGNAYIPKPDDHIDARTMEGVGSRGVNAFQFDHPELHRYYQQAAEDLAADADISNSLPNNAQKSRTLNGNQWDHSAMTSPALRDAMDETGLSRTNIIDAAQRLISDHGQENVAAAKRLELILDDMLTNGYETMDGRTVGANADYLAAKRGIPGYTEADRVGHGLDDVDADIAKERLNESPDLGAANAGFDPYTSLQNKYGNLSEGEIPARQIDTPAQTADDNRVSLTARTAQEAQATPDSRIPTIEQAVVDGKLSYVPVKNTEAAGRATEKITTDGWQKALTDWTADVRAGKTSADLTAMGATLLNNAGNSDMRGTQYVELLGDYSQMLRNGGQAVQAARMLKRMSPEGRLYMMQQSIESLAKQWAGKYDITLDPALADEYRSAQTDAARDEVIGKMQQNIADQIPSTLTDKFTALRYTNMLGNFKTQIRNVIGNAGMQPVRIAKDKIGAVLEAAANAASGGKIQRTKSFLTSPELVKQAWSDFDNVANEAMGEGKYEDYTQGQTARDIEDKRTIFKNNGDWGTNEEDNAFLKGLRKTTDVGWKALESYRKVTDWAMEHGDVGFSRFTYADALAGYLQANGVKSIESASPEVLDDARAYAIKQAQEATYRDNNWFSNWVSRIGRHQDTPAAIRAVSEGIVPFRKTPADVLARAEEYSPFGLINTAVNAVKTAKGNATASDVIDSLAKTLTGTGLVGLGYAAFNSGLIRGKDDDNERQKNFDDLLGHQAYSIELPGGKSYTLDWLAPESMPFFIGAQFAKAANINGMTFGDGLNALSSITDPMLQMSMMQGANDALDNLQYASGDMSNTAKLVSGALFNYLSQGFTNSLLSQAKYASEENRRTTYTDKNSQIPSDMQYMLGKASARIPGVNYDQTDYLDAWGRPQSNGTEAERVFNNFFNPAYTSDIKIRPVEQELQTVADATGDTTVLPAKAEKTITIGGGNVVNLDAGQFTRYQSLAGSEKYNMLNQSINQPWYRNMTAAEKADYIKTVYEYSTAKAAKAVVPNHQVDPWVVNAQTAQNDIHATPSQYLAYRQKYGSAYMSGTAYEKVKQAVSGGMTVDQYFSMKHGIDSNGNGSVSQAEAKTYLDKAGYNRKQAAEIWGIINKAWKRNPYR